MCYLIKLSDRIFVKGQGFLCFAKNIGKIVRKNISRNLRGKCSQSFLDHAKMSARDVLKTAPKKHFKKHRKQLVI